MSSRKKENSYLKNVVELIKYVWKFAPEIFFVQSIMIIGRIVINVLVYVSMLQMVVDAVAQNKDFKQVAIYICIVGIMQIIVDILNNFFDSYVHKIAKLKIHKGIHSIIFQKIQTVDLENYDNVEFYNDYIWTLEKADAEIISSYENIFKMIEYFGNAVTLFSVTLFYDKLLLLFVIIPLIINVLLGNYISRLEYLYETEINIVQRRKNYFRRVFYLKEYAKELKMYRISRLLRERFCKNVDEQTTIYKRFGLKFMFLNTFNDNLTSIFDYTLLCLYMAYRAIVQGAYTAGTCAAMLNAVGNMSYALEQLFKIIPKIKKNGMFAEKIIRMISYDSKIEGYEGMQLQGNEFERLDLNNVSFAYPNNEEESLKNINFSIEKGEKVAIVGMNGAGKTTLIKMIMRYYDVTKGNITYNGKDIRNFTTSDYRKQFSTIFQDFQIYALKLEENVKMDLVHENEQENIKEKLEESQLSDFRDMLSFNMTKEFDEKGLVFSGGQRQKLAIARALFRDANIVIMDEASSALDPISEAKINQIIMEKMREKSMIIISHRLSTIKHVNKICFMENGEIVEMGSHEELMKLNGKYAEMYNVQARQYDRPR